MSETNIPSEIKEKINEMYTGCFAAEWSKAGAHFGYSIASKIIDERNATIKNYQDTILEHFNLINEQASKIAALTTENETLRETIKTWAEELTKK